MPTAHLGTHDAGGRTRSGRARPLPALTGVRIVPALLVVMFHFLQVRPAPGPRIDHAVEEALAHIVDHGSVGVSFFFVLSGFILAYNYLGSRTPGRFDYRSFWIARIARIYPVYLLALAVSAVPTWFMLKAEGCSAHHLFQAAIAAPLLLQAWAPCEQLTWNGPGWSLSAEAFFYALFPFLVVPVARLNRQQLYGLATSACAMSFLFQLAYRLIASGRLPLFPGHYPYWGAIWQYTPALRLPEFILGVALGRLFLLAVVVERHGSGTRRRTDYMAAAGIGATLVIMASPSLPHNFPLTQALLPLFGVVIYRLARGDDAIAALFSRPILLLLGEASYALYLLHAPIWVWMDQLGRRVYGPAMPLLEASPLYFLVYLCIALGASILTLRLVEQSARAAIRRALARTYGSGVPLSDASHMTDRVDAMPGYRAADGATTIARLGVGPQDIDRISIDGGL